MKYFAYGSNMLAERLRARITAENPTRYSLECHRLRFHKRSSDCSGKCNVICTGQASDVVHGVIFDVPEDQIPELDKYEGVRCGYLRKQCRFLIEGVENDLLIYVADADHIDDALVPYRWYLDLVLSGAEQNGLPSDYISGLRAMPFTSDPKPDRSTRLKALEALEKYRKSMK
ncbi:MAG: gamma-glutamylcyclotransferase family protein [Thermodesulfobacteriota bacterium]